MWWVIVATSYGSSPVYTYFQGSQAAAKKAANVVEVTTQQNLFGPYASKAEAQAAVKNGQVKAPSVSATPQVPGGDWLSTLGGMIGSGLESGLVAFLTDIWNAIIGPVEIYLGISLAILMIIILFRNQLISLAPLAMALAA